VFRNVQISITSRMIFFLSSALKALDAANFDFCSDAQNYKLHEIEIVDAPMISSLSLRPNLTILILMISSPN
jgi:hypothetical protein